MARDAAEKRTAGSTMGGPHTRALRRATKKREMPQIVRARAPYFGTKMDMRMARMPRGPFEFCL